MTLQQLEVGDPHDNIGGYREAVAVANARGITVQNCLGDLVYEWHAPLTRHFARIGLQMREDVTLKTSTYMSGLEEGIHTDAQIQRSLGAYRRAKEIASRMGVMKYGKFLAINPQMRTNGGNWELEDEIKRVWGNQLTDGVVTRDDGITQVRLSGGGQAPVGQSGFKEGFFADDQDQGIHHIQKARRLLLGNEDIAPAEVRSHVSLVPVEGLHADLFSIQGRDLLFQMYDRGYTLPKVIIHGHNHAEMQFRWEKVRDPQTGREIEQARFLPGVMTQENNKSNHGSFCITHTNTDSGLMQMIEEYRVFETIGSEQVVVHYANHTIDHDEKEVTAEYLNREISRNPLEEMFAEKFGIDTNFRLSDEGITTDYSGLTGAEADKAMLRSLTNLQEHVQDVGKIVSRALTSIQLEVLATLDREYELTDADELRAAETVLHGLGQWMAQNYGMDYHAMANGNEILAEFYMKTAVESYFGVALSAGKESKVTGIRDVLQMSGKKVEDISSSEGNKLAEAVSNHRWNGRIGKIIDNLEADQLADMVDAVYKPLNIERAGTIAEGDKDKLLGLWIKGAWSKGLLTAEDCSETGLYRKTESFVANPKTREQIYEMMDIPIEQQLQDAQRYIPEREVPALLQQLEQNNAPVYHNNDGDYVLLQQGEKLFIPQGHEEEYQAINLVDELTTGDAQLIAGGETYFVGHQGKIVPVDLEAEGIDPDAYQSVPLWQAEGQYQAQANQMQRDLLQRGEQDLYRDLLNRQNGGDQGPLPPPVD